jgi:acyl-CoA synthetase (AMP-forming)/AMP-acid ligase II
MESAMVGLPDEEFGEKVAAVVVLKDGRGGVAPEILAAHCGERVASCKCPREITVVPGLPRNAMGNILKSRIVEDLQGKSFPVP